MKTLFGAMAVVWIVLILVLSCAPLPVQAAECIPGMKGKLWPNTQLYIRNGEVGKHAYAFCDTGATQPVPVYRTCAYMECPRVAQITVDYSCDIYPPGGLAKQGVVTPLPPLRAANCAELLAFMHADWPRILLVGAPE